MAARYSIGALKATDWYAQGSADLATGHGLDARSRFNCGSIAKLVTGLLAAVAWPSEGERERSVLGDYLPVLPPHANASIADCLVHRTGLWDFRSLLPLVGVLSTESIGVSRALSVIAKQPDIVAGFERQYSNTNFLLLGLALERKFGASLNCLVERHLGHDVGFFAEHPRQVIPGGARGYDVDGSVLREVSAWVDGRGSTNYWATASELARLAARVNDVTGLPPAGGVRDRSGRFISLGHDGGFTSALIIDPVMESVYVILSNNPLKNATQLLSEVFAFVIEEEPSDTIACPPPTWDLQIEPQRFKCWGLDVPVTVLEASRARLTVQLGDRPHELVLSRSETGSFSDGHVTLEGTDHIFLSVNHARGIPLIPLTHGEDC